MIENFLQKMILGVIAPFINKVLFRMWKRVVSYYAKNLFDLLPFILVIAVFPFASMNLPHISNWFQIWLFVVSLGFSTIISGIIGIVVEHKIFQRPSF